MSNTKTSYVKLEQMSVSDINRILTTPQSSVEDKKKTKRNFSEVSKDDDSDHENMVSKRGEDEDGDCNPNNKVPDHEDVDSDASNDSEPEVKRKKRQEIRKPKIESYISDEESDDKEDNVDPDDEDYDSEDEEFDSDDEDFEPEEERIQRIKMEKLKKKEENERKRLENKLKKEKQREESKIKKEEKEREKIQMKELTEYEKLVEKNKEEKMAFLQSLRMDEIKGSFADAVRPKTRPYNKRDKPKPPLPLRIKSQRSTKVDIDLSEEAIAARLISSANEEPIQTETIKLPLVLPFEEALQGDDLYENFVKDFSDIYQENTEAFDDHTSHFQNMKLLKSRYIDPDKLGVSSLTFHPMREKIIIASSGNKHGKLQIWNVNSDTNPYVFKPHTESITLLRFNPELPHLIVSSSYDGTLRCGDLVKSVFNEVFTSKNNCTYFDFFSSDTYLVAQDNGNIYVVDNRDMSKSSAKKHQCHDFPVKSVGVHPLNKNYFFTAESRGLLKLWDLRSLKKYPIKKIQIEAPIPRLQCAFFSPLTGKSILTSSSDGRTRLYDTSNFRKSLKLERSKKISYSKSGDSKCCATWLPYTDDAFVLANSLHPKGIGIYNDKMKNIFNFTDTNLNAVTYFNIFHPSLPVLAGTNQNGHVFVFADIAV